MERRASRPSAGRGRPALHIANCTPRLALIRIVAGPLLVFAGFEEARCEPSPGSLLLDLDCSLRPCFAFPQSSFKQSSRRPILHPPDSHEMVTHEPRTLTKPA